MRPRVGSGPGGGVNGRNRCQPEHCRVPRPAAPAENLTSRVALPRPQGRVPRVAYAHAMTAPLPAALSEAFAQWDGAGRPPASGSRWQRGPWEAAGVPLPARLDPAPITRERVAEFAAAVTADDQDAQREAFVVAMIWGFGTVPYGPFRLARIMAAPQFAAHLQELTVAILDGGAVEAYRFAHRRRRTESSFLKWLGPAFGTKYIYFVSLGNGEVGPILDEVVRDWFRVHVSGINLWVGQWGWPARYEEYAATVSDWGERLGVSAGDVEYLMFAQQQSRDGNWRWSEPWVGDGRSAEQLLGQLRIALASRGVGAGAAGALEEIERLLGGDGAGGHAGDGPVGSRS